MKQTQTVGPGVVITVVVVLIVIIGLVYYKGFNRTPAYKQPPAGTRTMMGPRGMLNMQQGQQNTAPGGVQPGTATQTPTTAGN